MVLYHNVSLCNKTSVFVLRGHGIKPYGIHQRSNDRSFDEMYDVALASKAKCGAKSNVDSMPCRRS